MNEEIFKKLIYEPGVYKKSGDTERHDVNDDERQVKITIQLIAFLKMFLKVQEDRRTCKYEVQPNVKKAWNYHWFE